MDQLTTNVRYQGWLQMLNMQKESGLTVKQWCLENHISQHCFYYRQQKLRERAGEALRQFVEIRQPLAEQHPDNLNSVASVTSSKVVIELNNNASEELISRIVRVLNAQ